MQNPASVLVRSYGRMLGRGSHQMQHQTRRHGTRKFLAVSLQAIRISNPCLAKNSIFQNAQTRPDELRNQEPNQCN